MFFGEFDYKIDEKNRVPVPPRFRNALKDGVVLAPGVENCITAYPVAEWKKLATEIAGSGVDALELNINLGHIQFEGDSDSITEGSKTSRVPQLVDEIVRAVAGSVNIPVIPKFTPHLIDPVEMAVISVNAGAMGISATNNLRGII